MRTIQLTDLVGEHVLTGVDRQMKKIDTGWGRMEDADTLSFVLDGITYTAVEDPEDGYRSMLGSIFVSEEPVMNTFPPCPVFCLVSTISEYGESHRDEVLEVRDRTTGKLVLSVGTEDLDDYYPSFVASFDPTAMAVNQ